MKNLNIGIRPTILTLFTIIVFITLCITLWLQYYFSHSMALESIKENMRKTALLTSMKIHNINNSINNTINVLEQLSEVNDKPKNLLEHTATNKFSTFLSGYPFIYAMYIGYENGDFYEVINLDIDASLRLKYSAKDEEKWLLLKVTTLNEQRVKESQFLNKELQQLRTTTETTSYNPTLRPWYKEALKSDKIIKTAPYAFSNFDSLGVTYAKKINGSKNILGVDISLNTLSSLLKSEVKVEGTLSYLIDPKNHKLIASNTNGSLSYEEIEAIIEKTKKGNLTIEHNNRKYFLSNTVLDSGLGKQNQLIVFTPKERIMQPYNEKICYAIILNLFVMLLFSPVMIYFTKLVSKPIHALEEENKKIKNRRFDEVKYIDTKISELSALSSSLASMSSSIQEYEEAQLKLMNSFIELIAGAIDAKSEYNGGHCNRVPIISIRLAQLASECKQGVFKDFTIENEEQLREISIAAWLHDCGKVTTPEYIVNKATKLETIYNRIHEVRMRFEVVYRDLIIQFYKDIHSGKNREHLEKTLQKEQKKLIEDFEFIATCNVGSEFMNEESKERVKQIAQRTWIKYFDDTLGISQEEKQRYEKSEVNWEYILSDKKSHIIPRANFSQDEYDKFGFKVDVPKHQYNLGEVYNLTINRGTLTEEDRFKINEHVIMTIKMLERLPFPEHLKNVPLYAGGHHETLIGTGYPRKLTNEELSIPTKIIALADVFEALTASDRPYKNPKKISEAIKILSFMVKDKHIDKDIFELFLTSGLYKEYAKQHLLEEQIDEIDIKSYLS